MFNWFYEAFAPLVVAWTGMQQLTQTPTTTTTAIPDFNLDVPSAIVDGISKFSTALQGSIKAEHPGNIILSPFSLCTLFAMLDLGARGKTAEEIANGFYFPSSSDEILEKGYFQLLTSLKKSDDGYILSVATKLYSRFGLELKKEFQEAVTKSFYSETEQIDFSENIAAAKKINGWVEDVTKNKITNLISPDSLSNKTSMVLVNGVYFKGLWLHKFNSQNTKKSQFHLNDNHIKSKEVDMMYQQKMFPYVDLPELDATGVALPFKGGRLSMIILLPNNLTDMSKLENGLSNYTPSQILEKMNDSFVDLYLPRFTIETTLKLKEPLEKLGMETMFNEWDADFSGISSRQLYVSEVVQKGFIEVNEEGSEAVAATAIGMNSPRSAPSSYPTVYLFQADHPFLFQIVDSSTKVVLFAGCFKHP